MAEKYNKSNSDKVIDAISKGTGKVAETGVRTGVQGVKLGVKTAGSLFNGVRKGLKVSVN